MIKVTGYLFDPDDESKMEKLNSIADVIREYQVERGHKLFAVTGAGELGRRYIVAARAHGSPEVVLDTIGIMFSRLNSQLLISILGECAHPNVPRSLEEIAELSGSRKTIVCGGLFPGASTNSVSTLIAEMVKADLLVTLTSSGGLYTKDPKAFEDAELVQEATPREMRKILSVYWEKAGRYPLMDQTAINVISRSRIQTIITEANSSALLKALEGKKTGTKVVFE